MFSQNKTVLNQITLWLSNFWLSQRFSTNVVLCWVMTLWIWAVLLLCQRTLLKTHVSVMQNCLVLLITRNV